MPKQNQQWMDYLPVVYDQWMDRMPVIRDEVSMAIGVSHEDPFWSSFDHAVRMANYHGMLSEEEYEFWLDFVEEEEYPTEDELNRFVNICKEGTNAVKDTSNCEFLSLTGLIEDIEGYWPYA